MRAYLIEELEASKLEVPALEEELRIAMLEHDPADDRNVIIELRGGTGGEEAAHPWRTGAAGCPRSV